MIEVQPVVSPKEFSKVNVGELFFFEKDSKMSIGIAINFEDKEPPHSVVILNPSESKPLSIVHHRGGLRVLSFGKNFSLRLPCCADSWTTKRPDDSTPYIAVSEDGKVYLHAVEFNKAENEDQDHFINMSTGYVTRVDYSVLENAAYALKWKILTTEKEPRIIFVQQR